jgi:CubicO group peptidase (beta-lactamase class C family)
MLRRGFCLLLTLLPVVLAQKSGLEPQRLEQISATMDTFVQKGTIAGAVTLISRHGGSPVIHSVGWQDIESKKPMRPDSIFQIMSMTKPVTAIGVMILQDEGKLSIEDPVEKYLPDFRKMWLIDKADETSRILKRPSRPIKIRDLLTHTSGMGGVLPDRQRGLEIFYRMDRSLAEEVAMYSQNPLDFEPGTKFQYSETGIATAGRIIEVVSKSPYEQFIADHIFNTLGMKDSFYFPDAVPEKRDRIAMVYRLVNGKLERAGARIPGGDPALYRKGAKYPCPDCGLFSTAADLGLLYQMVLNRGTLNGVRILSADSVAMMSKNHTERLPQARGLGWQILPGGGVSHGGAFGTSGWVDRANDLIGVFLIQRAGSAGRQELDAFQSAISAALVN